MSSTLNDQELPSSKSILIALILFIPVLFIEEIAQWITGNNSDFLSFSDVLITVLYVLIYMWYSGQSLSSIGLQHPESWKKTIRNGIILALLIQAIATVVVTIMTILVGGPDYSTFDSIRGNASELLYWLIISWTTAGFGEEFVMRGFLITYMIVLISRYLPEKYASGIAVALSSITFGLLHTYQGMFGIVTTGFVGLVLAIIFLRSNRNLWLCIITHGIMDSMGFVVLFFL